MSQQTSRTKQESTSTCLHAQHGCLCTGTPAVQALRPTVAKPHMILMRSTRQHSYTYMHTNTHAAQAAGQQHHQTLGENQQDTNTKKHDQPLPLLRVSRFTMSLSSSSLAPAAHTDRAAGTILPSPRNSSNRAREKPWDFRTFLGAIFSNCVLAAAASSSTTTSRSPAFVHRHMTCTCNRAGGERPLSAHTCQHDAAHGHKTTLQAKELQNVSVCHATFVTDT